MNYKKIENTTKEKIWEQLNLSGSKFKYWSETPDQFVKNEPKEFSDFVKEKMASGTKMEPVIFDWLKEKGLKLELDKETYEHTKYKNCYANIDGKCYLGKEWVVLEIKNSEAEFRNCLETYKYQLLYYSWFFNKKKAMFAVLTKGWKLRYQIVEFSKDEIKWCEKKVKEFNHYLETKELPEPEIFEFFENLKDANDNILDDIEFYESNIEYFKDLEEKLKIAKDNIKNSISKNGDEAINSNAFIYNIKKIVRKSLDTKKMEKYLIDQQQDLEQFKKITEISTLEIKEKK